MKINQQAAVGECRRRGYKRCRPSRCRLSDARGHFPQPLLQFLGGGKHGVGPGNFAPAMKDAEGKLFKFQTHSVGGANAIRRLLREWRRQRDRHLGLVPVIALGADSYVHRVHDNTIHVPTFEIVGWEPWDDDASPLIEVTPDDPRTQVEDDLQDEIPF